MQLKGSGSVQGVFEEILAPSLSADGQSHDFVYHLSGSITGHTLTYHLTALTPSTPPLPQTQSATVTTQSVVLSEPPSGGSSAVLTPATQTEFSTVVHDHASSWKLTG
jgi:hypothetical protein